MKNVIFQAMSQNKPQNASFYVPDIGKVEIYWQTQNANHILDNYKDRNPVFGAQHDLKFNDISKILISRNVAVFEGRGGTYEAVGYVSTTKKYYLIIFVVRDRFNQKFAIIKTAYATNQSHHIKKYGKIYG